MPAEYILIPAVLLGLLGIAVVSDLLHHRIPNLLVLTGIALGLGLQVYSVGYSGINIGLMGMLIGFAIFLPLYALGGMAAGDVKLMAMVGCFFTYQDAMWMAFYSLIAGSVCGFLIVLCRGQVLRTLTRYGLMLRTWVYLAPTQGEAAGKPFPYSVAILLGTLIGIFWQPLGH
ncbi:A24 family peptidase [Pseudomonas sp. TCU-HL1]|uniref:A24 family peptidase n=1 Tax=Pseudomonas sp. TCU-HL1 TaxID=1856685 RepID=UPI00083D8DDA|nr:prepilin peptidase [Pseudomonas sp. TCU-HL1]AOE84474.1 membrane protein [Pseudomonas sp. TCU-HL1]